MLNWYIVQTNPKLEMFAGEQLQNQELNVFIPVYKKKYFKKSQLFQKSNLFPGYIFVEFDLDAYAWKSINGTRGVKKILCMDKERPSPVNRSFMREIYGMVGTDGYIDIGCADEAMVRFNAGDKIKITSGAFTGLIGTFELSEKNRIAILLSCLGGKNRVWLDKDQGRLCSAVKNHRYCGSF